MELHSVQYIKNKQGMQEYVILSVDEFEQIQSRLEDLEILNLAEEAKKEDFLPEEQARLVWDGEHPIKVWRKYRGMTQKDLAQAVGLNPQYLSQIENRKRTGSVDTLRQIAAALQVSLAEFTD